MKQRVTGMISRTALLAAALALLPALIANDATRVAPGQLKAKTDYQAKRSNPVTYQVDFRAIVTAPYKTKLLRVWMPIPPSDNAQETSGSRFTTFPLKVEPSIHTEPVFGNTFADRQVPYPFKDRTTLRVTK